MLNYFVNDSQNAQVYQAFIKSLSKYTIIVCIVEHQVLTKWGNDGGKDFITILYITNYCSTTYAGITEIIKLSVCEHNLLSLTKL